MEITQEPLIRSRWNFLRLLPWMFTLQWRRRHSLMWHLWRQPWRHRRHGKCRMTQTSTRQGYGTVCVFFVELFPSSIRFRGREIQWCDCQYSTTTVWPRKSSLNRKYWNFEVTHLFPWWNFMISPIFMFSRSRNSMVTRSEFYDYRLTLKTQV